MHTLDLAVIAAYLIAITWFGARFRHGQKNLRDYFLGGRTAPWWAISLSIVSAETSTLTIVGTPALAFGGNLGFLQIVFGYLLARIVISLLFLPQYFRGDMFTAYELMRRRFGERVRKLTASIFLVTRALAEGVRVFAISLVISIVLGTGEIVSIVLIVCLTLFYTFEGGMTAVIWTDVVQMTLYVLGAIAELLRDPAADSRRLGARGAGRRRRPSFRSSISASPLEFFTVPIPSGPAWRADASSPPPATAPISSWCSGCSAPATSAKPHRAAGELGGHFRSVHPLSADRHSALRLLPRYRPAPPAQIDRIYPEFIWNHLPPGRRRADHCGDSGRGDGQHQRRAELARVHHRGGFLPPAAPRASAKRTSCGWRAGRPWSGAACCWASGSWRGSGARCWWRG